MTNPITPKAAIEFLEEAAKYFSKRPTGGEDQAHWSNVYNADNCKRVAELIKSMDDDINSTPKNPMEVYFEASKLRDARL